jgi:hypothetical protein
MAVAVAVIVLMLIHQALQVDQVAVPVELVLHLQQLAVPAMLDKDSQVEATADLLPQHIQQVVAVVLGVLGAMLLVILKVAMADLD